MALNYLDQIRYMVGVLLILLLLCHGVLPHRSRYYLRLVAGETVALVLALFFVPLWNQIHLYYHGNPIVTAPYWLLMSFVPVGFILFCYETNLAGALFRTMLGAFVENVATVLIRNLFVLCFFPAFPETHPLLYVLFMIAVYAAIYAGAYALIWKRIRTDESEIYPDPKNTARVYLFVYLSYTAILSTTKLVSEYIILPMADSSQFQTVYRFLQYFLVADLLLISAVMTIIMLSFYQTVTLRNERQIITQMVTDRQNQYEFSRENIEMINRKVHDLKHQLRALELVSDEERRQKLRETRKAIDFYDAVVKTGNEALDTILTEKSVYCQNRGIRLSCTVSTHGLGLFDVVDLYTLLGNAIDNAIEAVERLEEPDKRVVSLTIRDQGKMLYFHVENYFDGALQMRGGLPVTRKTDRLSHGYGVKSIRAIAERYGGSAMIESRGEIFSLEILIPAQESK